MPMTNADLKAKLQTTQAYFFAFLTYPEQATLTIKVTAANTSATLKVTTEDRNALRAAHLTAHFDDVFNRLSINQAPERNANGVSIP